VCSNCPCYLAKATRVNSAPIGSLLRDTAPFASIAIDTVGPISPSDDGVSYIMSIVCLTTRYIILKPLMNISTAVIIRELKSIFFENAFPVEITLDNFPSFQSQKFRNTMENYGIKLFHTPVFSPHRNGVLERQHRVINEVLRWYLNQHKNKKWASMSSPIQARINNRTLTTIPDSSIRITPFTLVHRYHYRYPGQGQIMETNPDKSFDELMDLVNRMDISEAIPNQRNRRYNFVVGDKVLRYSPTIDTNQSAKLNLKFKAGTITRVIGKSTFEIRDEETSKHVICDGRNLRRGGV